MKVEVLDTITYRGKRHFPGAVVDIAEIKITATLIPRGIVRPAAGTDNPVKPKGAPAPRSNAGAGGTSNGSAGPAEGRLTLDEAVAKLLREKKDGTLTGSGKPKVEHIEALTGEVNISAKLRDEAMLRVAADLGAD